MKKLFAIVLALAFALSLTAAAETRTIVIGATPSPHAEVLNLIADDMAALGYPIEVKVFNDYNLPCPAVASGELDANYFAHIPFINGYNSSVSEEEQVVPVIGVHYEPFGIYSNKYESLDELPENATVCIPNDVSNQTRALFLLQDAGLIVLPEDAQPTDELNVTDIVEIKNGLQISDIDAAQLPSTLEDKDIVVINGNFALDAGLSPLNDAIFYEPADGAAAEIYANYVVVRPEDVDAEWVEALRQCLCSEKVYEFMTDNEAYAGGVIPYFSLEAEEE
ncbi:MAG: MetQ/NlpA family ABC transporter substrate-binding protein [Candidatus Faecivicinus sp.]